MRRIDELLYQGEDVCGTPKGTVDTKRVHASSVLIPKGTR